MTPVESFVAAPQHSYTQARRHERVPVDFTVTLRWPGLRMADRARDLSEGGLAVETRDPLEPMTLVSMRLELPHAVPVDLLGRVMWSRGATMGIRFESTDTRLFDSLHRLRTDFDRI
jgi:PilZ domain